MEIELNKTNYELNVNNIFVNYTFYGLCKLTNDIYAARGEN
jgi:hypothetical protein